MRLIVMIIFGFCIFMCLKNINIENNEKRNLATQYNSEYKTANSERRKQIRKTIRYEFREYDEDHYFKDVPELRKFVDMCKRN